MRLLDTTWMRIGNPAYARDNGRFGLSTLRNRPADVRGDEIGLHFVGKAGIRHETRLVDPRVAGVLRACRALPGPTLFQYLDDAGRPHGIGSADVNAWLAEAAGRHVTAKHFRTCHGSVLGLRCVLAAAQGEGPRCRLREMLAVVAGRLGNTAAVCRKSYVHPRVLALVAPLATQAGRDALRDRPWVGQPPELRGLNRTERQLLGLLRER